MRFAFYTVEASTLSWQKRLLDEGNEVLVYCSSPDYKKIGQGIVPLEPNKETWLKWGLEDRDTIYFFDCTNAGELAERLRMSGKFVVNGGKLMDRLEKDRQYGEKVAAKIGMKLPPSKSFGSISAATAYLKTSPKQEFGDGGWAWKPNKELGASATFVGKDSAATLEFLEYAKLRWGDNVTCMLQEKIAGVALSTARWYNGTGFSGPYEATLEKKKHMNGEKGPATGCSLNLVWYYREDNPRCAEECCFEALEAFLRAEKAPPGLYDINSIVNAQGAWFLEWTPRLGVDSELTSQRAITNLGEFIHALAHSKDLDEFFDIDQVYCSVRLSVPPYPCEDKLVSDMKTALEVPVRGVDGLWDKHFVAAGLAQGKLGLEIADPFGMVGVVMASGTSLKRCYDKIYAFLDKKVRISNLQYRTDAYEALKKDLDEMKKTGWKTTSVLRME